MKHPLYFEAARITNDLLDTLLADPSYAATFLFSRDGAILALRGPAALPVAPSAWLPILVRARRRTVRAVVEREFLPVHVLITGVTGRLILAGLRFELAGFRARRLFRQSGIGLRDQLEELLRQNGSPRARKRSDPPSGKSGWAAVPLPGFIN